MKRYHWISLIVLIAAATFIFIQQRNAPYQMDEGKIFGTYYHITYQSSDNLHKEIIDALNKVDASMSMFNSQSTVSKINRGEQTEADPMLKYLFAKAQQVSETTQGAFDITVAPLVNAWGFGFHEDKWPTKQDIDSIMNFVGYRKVRLSGNNILKDDPRLMIDLSAIAKGYGSDVVARVLEKAKVRNYMIEIGGEIVTKGKNSKGKKWKIGVATPNDDAEQQSQFQCVLQLTDRAMATSGNYRNFYFKDGVKYAHTINPVTGQPVQQDIISATILAPKCYEADAYATACMVMGLEKSKRIIGSQKQIEAYLIYMEKGKQKVWMTEGFSHHIAK